MKRILLMITAVCVMLLSGCGCNRGDTDGDGIVGNDNPDMNQEAEDNLTDDGILNNDDAVDDDMLVEDASMNTRSMGVRAYDTVNGIAGTVGNGVENVGRSAGNVIKGVGNAMGNMVR